MYVKHLAYSRHIINDYKYTSYIFYKNSGYIASQVIPNYVMDHLQ